MKDVVIFGCGSIGQCVEELLPESFHILFADNACSGMCVNGHKVLSFEQYLEIQDKAVTVIATKSDYAEQIAMQLEEQGIYDYVYWEELLEEYGTEHEKAAMAFRINHPSDVFRDNVKALKEQIRPMLHRCKDSEVEFYFVDYFELSHYLPIYEALKSYGIKTVMVAEPRIINTKRTFNYRDTIKLLAERNIPYYTLANPDAGAAVTTQFVENLNHYRHKKCHVAYGVSFTEGKSFILDPANANKFDAVMVNGEFYRKRVLNNGFKGKAVSISYPRYKDFFMNQPTKDEAIKRLEIRTDKPIAVYLPTYDAGTSIRRYADAIADLKNDFYVLTRPHHCTYYRDDKKEDLRTLYRISDKVVHALSPLSDVAVAADLAICDARSGVMNEVSFLKPDIRKIALISDPLLDRFYIDISEFVDCVHEPDSLKNHAIRIIESGDQYIDIRKGYTDEFFDPDVEGGIKRAAETILEMAEEGKNEAS